VGKQALKKGQAFERLLRWACDLARAKVGLCGPA